MYQTFPENRANALEILRTDLTPKQCGTLEKLETELVMPLMAKSPIKLPFHGYVPHTRDDVFPNFVLLAKMAGISPADLFVGAAGVMLHDVGQYVRNIDHEEIGVEIVWARLPAYGFTYGQLGQDARMIMATKLVPKPDGKFGQNPHPYDILQLRMCDADLGNLGAFYLDAGRALLQEQKARYEMGDMPEDFQLPENELDWLENRQLPFIKGHKYFTPEAEKLFGNKKQKNIDMTLSLVKRIGDGELENRSLDELLALNEWVPPPPAGSVAIFSQ